MKKLLPLLAFVFTSQTLLAKPVLEEVMVTAQKREESLQDVPISVVAVDAQMMRDANMEDMADIAVFTPNLSVYSHPPFTSLRVRGLGSPFDKGFEHSAGLFLDGVYVGRLAFLDAAFLDVQSVEILRGPQGTQPCLARTPFPGRSAYARSSRLRICRSAARSVAEMRT